MVLAIDPGSGKCGWALGRGEDIVDWGQAKADLSFPAMVRQTILNYGLTRIVVERYDLRLHNTESYRTVKLLGACEYVAAEQGVDYAEVNPDAKLRTLKEIEDDAAKIGPHARDAEAIRIWDFRYGAWV
jgi:hypothetical protein